MTAKELHICVHDEDWQTFMGIFHMHQAMEEWAKIKRELGPCIQKADILLGGMCSRVIFCKAGHGEGYARGIKNLEWGQ